MHDVLKERVTTTYNYVTIPVRTFNRQNFSQRQTRQLTRRAKTQELLANSPQSVCCLLTCAVVSSVRKWEQPESGTILSALPSACRRRLATDGMQTKRKARASREDNPPRAPNQFSWLSESLQHMHDHE